ncbi:MAG TPA: hypothetical protein VJ992_01610 [Gemmatimonadales bacterium]|nr:hypothetical protein [Gemmatimonadales bacterium]
MYARTFLRSALPVVAFFALACASHAQSGGAKSGAVERAPAPGEQFFADLHQLTFGGQNAEAYFSPDGKQLIFQRQQPGAGCDQEYVMNTDGTNVHRISNGFGRTTCGWFYDGGKRILYSSSFAADSACPPPPDYSHGYVWPIGDFEIYTARPDGSDLQQLTHTKGYNAEATLSPDGKTLVFTSTRDGDLDIYTMNVDGTNVRRLTTTPGYDGGPVFSPDGKLIAYRAWHPQTAAGLKDYRDLLAKKLVRPLRMELWVMNADGSNQHQITSLGGANFAPFFTPDGKRIIFASNYTDPKSRNFDLYLINLDGTGLTQVTTDQDFDAFPMFSPDGKQLVFASNRYGSVPGETNIFIADWVEPAKD